jgi:hypothetical protein
MVDRTSRKNDYSAGNRACCRGGNASNERVQLRVLRPAFVGGCEQNNNQVDRKKNAPRRRSHGAGGDVEVTDISTDVIPATSRWQAPLCRISKRRHSKTQDNFTDRPSVRTQRPAPGPTVPPTPASRATTIVTGSPSHLVLAPTHPGCSGDQAGKSPASAFCG